MQGLLRKGLFCNRVHLSRVVAAYAFNPTTRLRCRYLNKPTTAVKHTSEVCPVQLAAADQSRYWPSSPFLAFIPSSWLHSTGYSNTLESPLESWNDRLQKLTRGHLPLQGRKQPADSSRDESMRKTVGIVLCDRSSLFLCIQSQEESLRPNRSIRLQKSAA